MRVLKFGGTSLGSQEAISKVLSILLNRIHNNEKIIVVVSAFSGITDQLIQLSNSNQSKNRLDILQNIQSRHINVIKAFFTNKEQQKVMSQYDAIFQELVSAYHFDPQNQHDQKRNQDYLMGFGERFSALIITALLKKHNIKALYTDTRNLIKTNEDYGFAKIKKNLSYKNISDYYQKHDDHIIIATGFIASTVKGTPTTLGRGGSDYTASIFGAAIQADAVEIWTDVDGLMTADPDKVKSASLITRVSYESAKHMSFFGAKVIYPPTIEPAMRYDIPIYIKNTFRPNKPGTIIQSNSNISCLKQYCISSSQNISLITIQGKEIGRIENKILNNIFSNSGLGVTLVTHAKTDDDIKFAFISHNQSLTIAQIKKTIDSDLSKFIRNYTVIENLSMTTIVHEDPSILFHENIINFIFRTSKHMLKSIIYNKESKSLSIFSDQKHETQVLNTTHNLFSSINKNNTRLFNREFC